MGMVILQYETLHELPPTYSAFLHQQNNRESWSLRKVSFLAPLAFLEIAEAGPVFYTCYIK